MEGAKKVVQLLCGEEPKQACHHQCVDLPLVCSVFRFNAFVCRTVAVVTRGPRLPCVAVVTRGLLKWVASCLEVAIYSGFVACLFKRETAAQQASSHA